MKERDRWSSRTTFILGALGSSVGLGNLWRFPFLVFDYGGGSFLIPYVIALIFIGVPILFLEITLGRRFQGGDPVCFSAMHPRMLGIGWMSLFGSFLLASYYPVIIAWIVIFFFNSFQDPLPWALVENKTGLAQLSTSFFSETVLQDSGGPEVQESVNHWLVLSLAFVWVCVYLSIFKGVSVVSKVVKFSVPIPILTLVVLLFTSVNREGAFDGINEYVGKWDFSQVGSGDIWQDAVGQVFFSVGVCFGIMTAYSSYLESRQGLLIDTLTIALLDASVSIFAGFVVFSTLGALAHDIGVSFNDEEFRSTISGTSLVFIAYPAGLSSIGNAPGPQIFSILFFVTLFFLAIDSQFSIVEALITGIRDSNAFKKHRNELIAFVVCFVLFIFSIFFALDNGQYFLDIVDVYLNGYIMIGIGTLECIATMWVYGLKESIEEHGFRSMLAFCSIYFLAMVFCPIFIILLEDRNVMAGFLWWIIWGCVAFYSAKLLSCSSTTSNYDIAFSGGASKLISFMVIDEYGNAESVPDWYSYLLHGWALLLKYLIPVFLYMIMITGANQRYTGDSSDRYDNVFENIGKFVTVTGWSIFFIFLIVEVDAYSDKHEYEEARELLEEGKEIEKKVAKV